MDIITIHKDGYGTIGVAKDYESAINFLLQEQWLNNEIEVLNSLEEWTTLKELGIDIGTIRKWDIETFNDFFQDIFYLDIDFLWGT